MEIMVILYLNEVIGCGHTHHNIVHWRIGKRPI